MAVALDAQALQNLVQAAVQAALEAVRPQAAAATFALAPGGGNAVWDFTTGNGLKLFISATRSLEEKFDGSQLKLQYFLDSIRARAETFGWTDILTMADDAAVQRDLTLEYGALTEDNVRAKAAVYQALDGRNRQAAHCLLTCISNTLSSDFYQELMQRKDGFKITVQIQGVAVQRVDGLLMLYALITLVAIETRATVANLLRSLQTLEKLMEDCKSDIKAFNTGVNTILIGLRARRAPIPDIVTNLFTAYKSCADAVFVAYIDRKEEAYEDRTLDVDAPTLMTMAYEKYKVLEGKGQWMKKTDQELKFIAMEAQLQANAKTKTPADNGKKTGKPGGRPNDAKWAWKSIIKPGDENKEKTFEGKVYVHCPFHGDTKWVLKVNREGIIHKQNCTKNPKYAAKQTAKPPGKDDDKKPSAEQMSYAKALAHVMDNEGKEPQDVNDEDI